MLRRFSKKNRTPNSAEASLSLSNEEAAREKKKLLNKFLEFITSSIWSIPIASFIESQSVVFDRQQMETEIYIEIHKEYSQLIDTLIECFCEDVGTTSTELIEAIRLFNQNNIQQKYKVALEPLLAAQNFNVFVPMMMRKNIELQLQALQMIEFMCGLIPSVLQLEDGETLRNMKKLTPEETERYVLISVLRHSKDEYDAMQTGSEELGEVARNSRFQREALEHEIRREEMLLQKALSEGMPHENNSSSTQTDGSNAPMRSVAALMAATFSIDTATSTDDVTFELMDQQKKATSSMTPSDGVFYAGMGSSSAISPRTMTSSSGGDEMIQTENAEKDRQSRPKSAKRVGPTVGKRSKSGSTAKNTTASEFSETGGYELRPGTGISKTLTGITLETVTAEKTKDNRPVTSQKNMNKMVISSTTATETESNECKHTETSECPQMTTESVPDVEIVEENVKKPARDKEPNERKYSNAGLEGILGPKHGTEDKDEKSAPKSRHSSRKSTRAENVTALSRASFPKTATSHEPRAKTPTSKNAIDRPSTRRSSVDKNAPKRNDSVPRERKTSVSHKDGDKKPPKHMEPLRSNKYDGEVVLGQPESPRMSHGPRRKNLNDVNARLVDPSRLNSSDVRLRGKYLREQRDKLLQMKNEERIKQMNDIQRNSLERPRTTARAREILDKKEKNETNAIRKEISDKLKTQILTLQN